MKVIANPTVLDAVEWNGMKETFEEIKELADKFEDDVYMRDGQLVIYDYTFEEEEVVEIGDFVVFEHSIEIYSPISFDVLYQEWEAENDTEI